MNFETTKVFGEKDLNSPVNPDDMISALQFNPSGNFLASGDASGRIVIFRYNTKESIEFATQVHAHKSEFDYLRSKLSEPRICAIRWIPKNTLNPLFLTTNMHETKLWRLQQTPNPKWAEFNADVPLDQLVLPQLTSYEVKYEAVQVQKYFDIETEFIVSIEALYDQTSFMMVDVGCVKLWDIERDVPAVTSFVLVSSNYELTASAVTPEFPYSILLSDDVGIVRLIDMRQQSSNLTPSAEIDTSKHIDRNIFIDGTEVISSLNFLNDSFHFVSRNFGQLMVYDLRNPVKPEITTDIQSYPGRMEQIVDEGYTRDVFGTTVLKTGEIATGRYGNQYIVWDWKNNTSTYQIAGPQAIENIDFMKKIGGLVAHPRENVLAVASSSSLYFQSQK